MYDHFYMAVALGALAHTGMGMVWYSPLLFGNFFKKLHANKPAPQMNDFMMAIVWQLGISLLTVAALFVAIATMKTAQTEGWHGLMALYSWFFKDGGVSMIGAEKVALFLWAGFNLPVALSDLVWCKEKSLAHHAVCSGSDLVSLVVAAAVISFVA